MPLKLWLTDFFSLFVLQQPIITLHLPIVQLNVILMYFYLSQTKQAFHGLFCPLGKQTNTISLHSLHQLFRYSLIEFV